MSIIKGLHFGAVFPEKRSLVFVFVPAAKLGGLLGKCRGTETPQWLIRPLMFVRCSFAGRTLRLIVYCSELMNIVQQYMNAIVTAFIRIYFFGKFSSFFVR